MPDKMMALVTIADRGKGEEIAEFCRENAISYNYLTLGRGTVNSELLTMLGLGEIDKDILISLLPRSAVKTHLAGLSGLLKLKRPGAGIAFSMPLLAINALVAQCILDALPPEKEPQQEGDPMPTKFSLILVIAESGYADQVMEAAKAAGATGGTLLHARGVGREENESIVSASLQTEKEIVLILAGQHNQRAIMENVNKTCGILTEAKGVVLALPVEEIAGIS